MAGPWTNKADHDDGVMNADGTREESMEASERRRLSANDVRLLDVWPAVWTT